MTLLPPDTERPSTNWHSFLDQLEERMSRIVALIKSQRDPNNDGSGVRSALAQYITELREFMDRPTSDK